MSFIIDHQIPLLLGSFLLGVVGAFFVYRRDRGSRWWRVADFVWIGLGGLGALAAILSGIYQEDQTRLDRQIDVAYAITRGFDTDAARFRLAYCEERPALQSVRAEVRTLCERVEFLQASTARIGRLPLFLDVVETAEPLRALRFLFGGPEPDPEAGDARAMADAFDPAAFLTFAARTKGTDVALETLALRPLTVGIAAEYLVIAQTYEDLIMTTERLIEEWQYLQAHSQVLALQVIALCLIAIAAPFRLGKSVAEF